MTSFIREQKLSKATQPCVKKQSPYLPNIDVVTVNHNLIQLTENHQLPGMKYLIQISQHNLNISFSFYMF